VETRIQYYYDLYDRILEPEFYSIVSTKLYTAFKAYVDGIYVGLLWSTNSLYICIFSSGKSIKSNYLADL
jgi:hypothetical protein